MATLSPSTVLTALEAAVLAALFKSAESNGHDFGMAEDARSAVKTKRQLSGAISSLVKKGIIEVAEPHNVNNSGNWVTQFTWCHDVAEVRALLGIEAKKAEEAPVAAPVKEASAKKSTKSEGKTEKVTVTEHQAQALREAINQAGVTLGKTIRLEGRALFIEVSESKKDRKALLGGILRVLETVLPSKRDDLVAALENQLAADAKVGEKAHWHASLHINNFLRSALATAALLRARFDI